MSKMPVLPLDSMVAGLSENEERIVRACFTGRGVPAGHGRLLTNKPFKRVESPLHGYANYVWRMLCFDLAGFGKHACMPICADFDCAWGFELENGGKVRYGEAGYNEYNERAKAKRNMLDELIKRVESVLPIESKKGLLRWARALGY